MYDYQKLYKKKYGRMSSKKKFKEVCRLVKKEIKPMALLAAIILLVNSRS